MELYVVLAELLQPFTILRLTGMGPLARSSLY
jgi:hypothetical protein